MKILVTGSSGMIGSALVPKLEELGHEVVALDRRLPEFTFPKNFMHHDLLQPVPAPLMVDMVIHLAAHARVWELVEDPSRALENVVTTHNAFEYARRVGAKIMIASSREVYGNGNELPVDEWVGSQRQAESTYSASKIFGEAYAWAYMRSYELSTRIVRFSNVYGKYDFSDRFIPKVIKNLKINKPVEIWGEKKFLDFTHIDDTVAGIIHLMNNWETATLKEWNIASGKGYTLLEVAKILKEKIGSTSNIEIGNSNPGEVFEYEADITRMKSIGWEPKVTLDQGLNESIKYYAA